MEVSTMLFFSRQVGHALAPMAAPHGMPILQCPPGQAPCQVHMPMPMSEAQPIAHSVSAQYPGMGQQFAHPPPVQYGSQMPLATSWDPQMHYMPPSALPSQLEPAGKPQLQKLPAWQPAAPAAASKFPTQPPQQVLVLSNFLQEVPPQVECHFRDVDTFFKPVLRLWKAPRKLEAQLPAEVQDTSQAGGITTLMLRNIPVTFNRESLLADFDARGFRGQYDFFYLPIDFQTDNNLGYAFVNLVTPMSAERFRSTYQGLALAGDRSKKICAVAPATTQGRAANVEYYRNSNVMSMEDKYQPVVFENGMRARFPAPTKAVKPIRYRESRGVVPE
ncbi:unnamed protein product [Durusdinium trenchii]|uniref:RRM domain-containing protein n=1 Tax=Durusdinium trenchii TaxID=1381693 RepID=A0ABP0HCT4_9DINO